MDHSFHSFLLCPSESVTVQDLVRMYQVDARECVVEGEFDTEQYPGWAFVRLAPQPEWDAEHLSKVVGLLTKLRQVLKFSVPS